MRVLITREIMHSRDAQCNTGEWPEMMMMSSMHLTQYYIKYINDQFAVQNIETWQVIIVLRYLWRGFRL